MYFRAEFRILLKKVRNEYLPAGMNADGKLQIFEREDLRHAISPQSIIAQLFYFVKII